MPWCSRNALPDALHAPQRPVLHVSPFSSLIDSAELLREFAYQGMGGDLYGRIYFEQSWALTAARSRVQECGLICEALS